MLQKETMKKRVNTIFLITTLFSICSFAQVHFTVKGKNIISPNGKSFQIKGTNLGNWLVPEGYMFAFKDVSSPRLINQTLTELVGPDAITKF